MNFPYIREGGFYLIKKYNFMAMIPAIKTWNTIKAIRILFQKEDIS